MARRRGRRPSARRGQGRRRRVGGDRGLGRATRGSSRSARPGSTTTGCSRRPGPARRTCGGTSPSPLATGKPAILHCRSAAGERDAQDALLGELRAAGFGGTARGLAFGGSAAGRDPPLLRARSTTPATCSTLGARDQLLGPGVPGRRGGDRPRSAALVPADRLLVETDSPFLSPPGRPARRATSPNGSWR